MNPRMNPSMLAALVALLLANAAMGAEPASQSQPPKPAAAASTDAMPAVQSPAPTGKPAEAAPPVPRDAKPAAGTASGAKKPGSDRLDLDTTVVTGNRELPKVLYIVPWKRSDLGDLPAQPLNSLLDEVLAPVDRDVFRREVTYYGAFTESGGAGNSAPANSAAGSEK